MNDDIPTLRFESPQLRYGIRNPSASHAEHIDGWRIHEEYNTEPLDTDQPGIGTYQVILESTPTNLEEAPRLFESGVKIAEQLEMLWLYVGASPLSGPQLGLRLAPLRPPKRWKSNFEDVRRNLEARELGIVVGSFSIESRSWAYPAELPLRQALLVRQRYLASDHHTKALVELHHQARTTFGQHAREVAFARALELVAELLPGHRYADKATALPEEVRENLSRPFCWLYELSNRRFNTRHVVDRQQKPELLPPMSGEEYMQFVENADLVVRGVVAARLDVPLVLTRKGSPE